MVKTPGISRMASHDSVIVPWQCPSVVALPWSSRSSQMLVPGQFHGRSMANHGSDMTPSTGSIQPWQFRGSPAAIQLQ